ncbi:MAG: amidohydrolase family protein [Candidatus Cloacimonadaceae bacterium]|jgi:hypothetical protein|nr:amidohydrolase family protein [Candidatus Cloacimonadota bacterium]MCB5257539.1 amidohydrolase family protein [Candidatus Cloacimonadota bacterium]MDD5625224.1 amidohydrolase family protein [Candidatus Cloacimonadota bacterium]MDY0111599.1 amidohydrolase family protein [Candidatus Syntrophosphaera sp.]
MKLFTNVSLPTTSAAFKRVNVLFNETIIKISSDEIQSDELPEVIDLKGKILLPGGVDAHSHIITDKDPEKNLSHITKSALLGGWTSFAELSYFIPKPIFHLEDLNYWQELIEKNSYLDMAIWGNVDMASYPYHAEAAQQLWSHGIAGLALFYPSPNHHIPTLSLSEIMDLFLDIYESDTLFAFQGYDFEEDKEFSFQSQDNAIKKLLRRIQENPIHIPRISFYPTIEFLNSIYKRTDISYALCIGDLMKFFSGIDLDQEIELDDPEHQLFELLRTNKIYMLSNNVEALSLPKNVSQAFRGTTEKLLPYSYLWTLSELWKKRKVPLATVIKMTSENSAKRLGLYPIKGCLAAGSDADFVVYNPEKETFFKAPDGSMHKLEGSIEEVYLRGNRVVQKGKVSPPSGSFLLRKNSPKRRYNTTSWI